MAFIAKNQHRVQSQGVQPVIIDQWILASQPTNLLPQAAQSSTGRIFRVYGGRVLARAIIGQVTTVIQSQTTNIKVTSKALDNTPAAIGTAVDLSANVDGNAKEVGSLYVILQSGAAAIWSNAGAGLSTLGNGGGIILPQGELYVTTGADSSGKMKWDLWYQPIDPGAYVVPETLSATGILQTAL